MINLVTTMSRYLMILLILIYTYYNFRFFSLPDDESKLRLCRLQNVPLFLIFLLSGTIIYLQTEDEAVVLFFGAQLIFFVLYQLQNLEREGIPAALIGRTRTAIGREIYSGEVHSFLDRPKPDEIDKMKDLQKSH